MNKLPIQCRARADEIFRRADYLTNWFINGNRNDVAVDLLDMEPKAALAVLATMMENSPQESRSMARYFVETA
jgi:hypothetical protein